MEVQEENEDSRHGIPAEHAPDARLLDKPVFRV